LPNVPKIGTSAVEAFAMARNTSISLGDHFVEFVEEQVATGRFQSASEVVRAGLRLLEESETKLRELRAALEAGEASGPAKAIDKAALMKRLKAGAKREGRAGG
jgi:antitoxin ParD1/3/4